MGLLSNTVSICQFRVIGNVPDAADFVWAGERLAGKAFRSIDGTSEELSVGWVHLDDPKQGSFEAPNSYWRDHWLTFSLRRDQRRVPSAVLKGELELAEGEFLAAHPGLKRVPKAKKEELREALRGALMSRTLPVPSVWDAVWDTREGILTLTSLSPKVIELFENLFKTTFEGLRLVAIHPFARAEGVISPELAEPLRKANRSATDAVLDLIRDNAWIGADFLRWLLFRTLNEASEYMVTRPGPAQEKERFAAYLNNRMILLGGAEDGGLQKVTVAGPQDRFREACTALESGKEIAEATLFLERGDDLWKLTLKGSTFHFAGLKSPGVKLEKDDLTDKALEKEAIFYERMLLLETGLQIFDSLFAAFLEERLGEGWGSREKDIREGLAAA